MIFPTILVPIDTSFETDYWVKAPLQQAVEMAQRPGGLIHVMSVIPRDLLDGYYPNLHRLEIASQVKNRLDAIVASHCPADVNVVTSVAEGGICPEILRVAREVTADAIVMASHGPVFKDYVLGSNSTHIALHAHCSVFVVRDTQLEAA